MLTAAIVRWIASSLALALLVVEHGRLARRCEARWPALVPLAPVALALRRGERFAPALSLVAALAWLALRATS